MNSASSAGYPAVSLIDDRCDDRAVLDTAAAVSTLPEGRDLSLLAFPRLALHV